MMKRARDQRPIATVPLVAGIEPVTIELALTLIAPQFRRVQITVRVQARGASFAQEIT